MCVRVSEVWLESPSFSICLAYIPVSTLFNSVWVYHWFVEPCIMSTVSLLDPLSTGIWFWLMWSGCSPACSSHATCYYNYNRGYFCACDGYFTGNGYTCTLNPPLHMSFFLNQLVGRGFRVIVLVLPFLYVSVSTRQYTTCSALWPVVGACHTRCGATRQLTCTYPPQTVVHCMLYAI